MDFERDAFSFAAIIVVGVFSLVLIAPILLLWFLIRKRKRVDTKGIKDHSLNVILILSFAGWVLEFIRRRKLILESADPIFSATIVFFVIFLLCYFTLYLYRKLFKKFDK